MDKKVILDVFPLQYVEAGRKYYSAVPYRVDGFSDISLAVSRRNLIKNTRTDAILNGLCVERSLDGNEIKISSFLRGGTEKKWRKGYDCNMQINLSKEEPSIQFQNRKIILPFGIKSVRVSNTGYSVSIEPEVGEGDFFHSEFSFNPHQMNLKRKQLPIVWDMRFDTTKNPFPATQSNCARTHWNVFAAFFGAKFANAAMKESGVVVGEIGHVSDDFRFHQLFNSWTEQTWEGFVDWTWYRVQSLSFKRKMLKKKKPLVKNIFA
jgi:hypothetical protein